MTLKKLVTGLSAALISAAMISAAMAGTAMAGTTKQQKQNQPWTSPVTLGGHLISLGLCSTENERVGDDGESSFHLEFHEAKLRKMIQMKTCWVR